MKRPPLLPLIAGLALLLGSGPLLAAGDPRQDWLQATVQGSAPVREQLAMLSQPGQPLAIRVYRGDDLRALTGQPLLARLQGQELALSEGLLEQLHQLQQEDGATSARWTLLYVLAYLGARHPQLQPDNAAPSQLRALAMLSAFNQVLATAWEEAGRPMQPVARERLLRQVLQQVSYARQLQPALALPAAQGLRRDADGFVLDLPNARLLASTLHNRTGHRELE